MRGNEKGKQEGFVGKEGCQTPTLGLAGQQGGNMKKMKMWVVPIRPLVHCILHFNQGQCSDKPEKFSKQGQTTTSGSQVAALHRHPLGKQQQK